MPASNAVDPAIHAILVLLLLERWQLLDGMKAEAERFWRRKARMTAIRHNLAWWLSAFLPALIWCSLAFAATVLILRRFGEVPAPVWWIYLAMIGVAAVISWAWTRRRFFSVADGMVRLDVSLGLDSRLAAAHAGVGKYPLSMRGGDGYAWRWQRMLAQVLGVALLLAGAVAIPISRSPVAGLPVEPPVTWSQMEQWIETLEESDAIREDALQTLREKLDELRDQSKEEWYSHSSLEAGDSLREQMEGDIRSLQRGLASSEELLAMLEKAESSAMSVSDLNEMKNALGQAIRGLEIGNLPVKNELLNGLRTIDPLKVKQPSARELAEMQKRLKEGVKACAACTGMTELKFAIGTTAGNGGIDRGPGTVPLNLSERESNLYSRRTESVSSEDLSRALPGEVLGVGTGEHQSDAEPGAVSRRGGAISSAGSGGDAVWREDLTPDEREILKRYFK